jgi:2-polyprenyl-6-hydroxyphenyl methylase/3-demethylubiquinone-9 3-methyltransferase
MSDILSVDETELNKFSKLAKDWWDKNGPLKTLHDINQIRADYVEKFQIVSGLKLLDLGCGGGILSEEMALRGAIVKGIDPETAVINVAKEHAKVNNLAINYECCAVEKLADGNFSVVTCLEMLEHVSNPELIIANAKRLLTPGGYLFLSTINRTVKSYLQVILAAEYVLNLLPRQTHDFSKFIKPSELCSLLRDYSFELLDISGMSYNPITRKAFLTNSLDVNYLVACRLS